MATLTDDTIAPKSTGLRAESAMDYRMHRGTYERFIHLVKWFIFHLGLLVLGLYFSIIAGDLVTGTLLILGSLVVMGYGIFSIPKLRRDVEAAIAEGET